MLIFFVTLAMAQQFVMMQQQPLGFSLKHVVRTAVEVADEKMSYLPQQLLFNKPRVRGVEVSVYRHDIPDDNMVSLDELKVKTMPGSKSYVYPDYKDAQTVLALAKMSNNAYNEFNSTDWWNIDGHHTNISFGRDSIGLRGFVYESDDGNVMIISVKGTSTSFFGFGGGPTGTNDKFHDNLMFSCCCAAVDWTWRPICPCSTLSTVCSVKCMQDFVDKPDSYFNMAKNIYKLISDLYPGRSIWFTGHSLGGAVASLAAYDLGVAAITFEAPGDRLYADRLQILQKQRKVKVGRERIVPIWQFGVPNDPLFTGKCNGKYSLCYADGYAMETKCHLGNVCVIPEIQPANHLNFGNDTSDHDDGGNVPSELTAHRIQYVVKRLQDLEQEKQFKPDCHTEGPEVCSDCQGWIWDETLR